MLIFPGIELKIREEDKMDESMEDSTEELFQQKDLRKRKAKKEHTSHQKI